MHVGTVGHPENRECALGSWHVGDELSTEEMELLELLAQGLPLGVIARRMYTSDRTLRRRIQNLCAKVGVGTPIEAVTWAVRRELI
jgi:DNA-binding NarL/FixJ family response regulator